ncbi:MAG: phosphoglucomutase/phosphomannomutase family protein, partial [Clostridia bacterium]|nr:phosphoglucomutase/phosphomannomutase family protein [Clostridia bacterium]
TERDAFFGDGKPKPTEKVMEGMKRDVIKGKYDFAMATDSDVDRLGIIDEQGNYVSSNDILAALYYYLVKYRGMSGDV